jgi:Tol biopolymer transport system component/tRNA A-37 threonylcarbamoyl transferase component Bud32
MASCTIPHKTRRVPELLNRLRTAFADRYRLESEIGAGGMATVYLAQDLRHDRRVAVKVLRPELAAVIGAERFLAEIKLTANLQHPHILPLFDSGEADSFLYYVMPFVAGETLRDRLRREKQLPVGDAVRIASEVASALDYAHRHGVVHRDIKPENILLHEGQALVADFGIALAASKAGGDRMTETGMSLGTPYYMSPEQAMGEREITARSDVYALGAVLYEMLTGDPPFTGSTAQAIVARVVTETPRPLKPQRHTITPQVETAVLTALEKLPADRFGTAAEFAQALSASKHVLTTAATPIAPAPGPAPEPAERRRRWNAPTVAALGIAAVATAAALWVWLRPAPAPEISRFSLFFRPGEGLQPRPVAGSMAISPDGRKLVYVGPGEGGSRLWLRELGKLRPSPIPGTEGAVSPFFAPDGRQLGYIAGGRAVRVLSLEGGPPLTLSDSINSTAGDWGDDGYVYVEVDSGMARVRATGGPLEELYRFSNERREIGTEWPHVLPGGKGLLFRVRRASQPPTEFDIFVKKLPTGEARPLIRGLYARYAASGHLLVVTADGKLLAVPFDPEKLELTGPAVAILEGLRSGPFEENMAVSRNGTFVYATGGSSASSVPFWVDRDGRAAPVDPAWDPGGTIESVSLSADGKALAVTLNRLAAQDVWVKQLPSGPFSRITFGDNARFRPTWSADARSLIYLADEGGIGSGIPATSRADGTGAPRTLLKTSLSFAHVVESRDGSWLVLRRSLNEVGAGDIYAVKRGDTTLVPLLTTAATETAPALSPDGRWLAYASNESGTSEIYVRPFPDVASGRWQVSLNGGSAPKWANSGRELFYINGAQEMVVTPIRAGSTLEVGQPKALFSAASYFIIPSFPTFDIAPDDKRFIMLRSAAATEDTEIILTQNWFEELKARAPR